MKTAKWSDIKAIYNLEKNPINKMFKIDRGCNKSQTSGKAKGISLSPSIL